MPKPEVTIPAEPAPTELQIDDLSVGDGEEATPGRNVEVHYVGVGWSNGTQFDTSWDRGDTFSFRLGGRQVIDGWDQGVAGMRVGGRRASPSRPTWAMASVAPVGSSAPTRRWCSWSTCSRSADRGRPGGG